MDRGSWALEKDLGANGDSFDECGIHNWEYREWVGKSKKYFGWAIMRFMEVKRIQLIKMKL
jgi:hypothetical protein